MVSNFIPKPYLDGLSSWFPISIQCVSILSNSKFLHNTRWLYLNLIWALFCIWVEFWCKLEQIFKVMMGGIIIVGFHVLLFVRYSSATIMTALFLCIPWVTCMSRLLFSLDISFLTVHWAIVMLNDLTSLVIVWTVPFVIAHVFHSIYELKFLCLERLL